MFFTIYTFIHFIFVTHAAIMYYSILSTHQYLHAFNHYYYYVPSVHVTSPTLCALEMPKSDCRLKLAFDYVQIQYCNAIDVL